MRQRKLAIAVLLAVFLFFGALMAHAENADDSTATILFVCEHGNVKSLMAASYFNQVAHSRHLPFIAISRGLVPDSTNVPPAIAEGLGGEGIDVSSFHPTKLTALDITSARRIISISLPANADIGKDGASISSWDDVPPASVDFNASSAAIKAHIEVLIAELMASPTISSQYR